MYLSLQMEDISFYNHIHRLDDIESYPLFYDSMYVTSNFGTNMILTMQSFNSACTIDKMGSRLKAER